MSYAIQEYPILDPLTVIQKHNQLPPNATELGRLMDNSTSRDELYVLVKNQSHLSVLVSYHAGPNDQYFCDQFDFPLKTLSWFPWALEEFRKPPAEGGLHAGAMISKDMDVDGEMLAVGSTSDGYCLTNWSRNHHYRAGDYYEPIEISFSYDLLYRLGFLHLWKSLGEKYERGEI